MSICTRRKHVLREMMEDDYKLPTAGQEIVRVVRSCGNNLHEVETADENTRKFLVSMPNKFRRMMWIKRGDYVLVEPIAEGDKVKAEICRILMPEHILEYDKGGVWPEAFKSAVIKNTRQTWKTLVDEDESAEYNQKYFLIKPNCNRHVIELPCSDTEDEEDSDDEDEEDSDDEDEEDSDNKDEENSDNKDEEDNNVNDDYNDTDKEGNDKSS